MVGMGRSNPTALWVSDSDKATATSARMVAELAGGDSDAGLASAVDGVEGCGLGRGADGDAEVDVAQVAGGTGELGSSLWSRRRFGFVEELRAGGVSTGATVVVGWVPVGEADEQDGVDRFGDVGVAEPGRLAAFLATGAHPAGEAGRERVGVVDDDGLDERGACRPGTAWPPDLGAVMAAAAISLATWRTVSARRSS